VKTRWDTGVGAGGFFELDLGRSCNIGQVLWTGTVNGNLEVWASENGNFGGEQRRFFADAEFGTYIFEHNDACPEEPALRQVAFTSAAQRGRYVRFVFPQGGGLSIAELRVFEAARP